MRCSNPFILVVPWTFSRAIELQSAIHALCVANPSIAQQPVIQATTLPSLIAPRTEPSYIQAHQHQPNPCPHKIRKPRRSAKLTASSSPCKARDAHNPCTESDPPASATPSSCTRRTGTPPQAPPRPLRRPQVPRRQKRSARRATGPGMLRATWFGCVFGFGGCGRLRWPRRCVRVRRGWEGVRLRWLEVDSGLHFRFSISGCT